MGREEEAAETPRRARGKRDHHRPPPPMTSTMKYDPTLPHHNSGTVVASHPHQVYNAAIASHPQAMLFVSAEEAPGSSNKRKRVKKPREEEQQWLPMAPTPPSVHGHARFNAPAPDTGLTQVMTMSPPSAPHATAVTPAQYQHHTVMPSILNHDGNVTNSVAQHAPPPPEFELPQASNDSAASTTVFEVSAAPVIQSFAETERRRNSATNSINLTTLDAPSSAVSTPQNGVQGRRPSSATTRGNVPALWANSETRSVFDIFFPGRRSRDNPNPVEEPTAIPRESKRRRRNRAEPDRNTRSSRRAAARDAQDEENVKYDMLRFGVDVVKLVPQGLVDRIDTRLRPEFVATVIRDHVDNWVRRAGFGHNFLQEITTLLNAYYPCTYPTILDEVLASFIFKRPELAGFMLKSMVKKLQKSGESASAAKYPVISSFARKCDSKRNRGCLQVESGRLELASVTLLRYLLTHNTEKYNLSPWIALCASKSTDVVLGEMWGSLLRPLVVETGSVSTKKGELKWNVSNPLDQVFELLREERLSLRSGEEGHCKLSMTLILTVMLDERFQSLRSAPVICEAFEIFFTHSTTVLSAHLLQQWTTHVQNILKSPVDAEMFVLKLIMMNCSRLSVKKTHWFTKHCLRFALAKPPTVTQQFLEEILMHNTALVLGAVDKHDVDELSFGSVDGTTTDGSDEPVVNGLVQSNEKLTEDDSLAQVVALFGMIKRVDGGTRFVSLWTELWCRKKTAVLIPWSYVWSIVRYTMQLGSEQDDLIDSKVTTFAEKLCGKYFERLLRGKPCPRTLERVEKVLHLTMTTPKANSRLLLAVLDAVGEAISLGSRPQLRTVVSCCIATNIAVKNSTTTNSRNGDIMNQRCSQVVVLKRLCEIAPLGSEAGILLRALLSDPKVHRVVGGVLALGKTRAIEAALQFLLSVASTRHATGAYGKLFDVTTIESVISVVYRTNWATASVALNVLELVSRGGHSQATSVLWTLLRSCTKRCCGCAAGSRTNDLVQTRRAAIGFSDLTKLILTRISTESLVEVAQFIQQHLVSCSTDGVRWNFFLIQVLDRILQLGLTRMSVQVVRLVVAPFENESLEQSSDRMQLQILQALCCELLSTKHAATSSWWLDGASLACSNQVRSKLDAITTRSTCVTSVALARKVSRSSFELKKLVEAVENVL